jgi:hypothetical protein
VRLRLRRGPPRKPVLRRAVARSGCPVLRQVRRPSGPRPPRTQGTKVNVGKDRVGQQCLFIERTRLVTCRCGCGGSECGIGASPDARCVGSNRHAPCASDGSLIDERHRTPARTTVFDDEHLVVVTLRSACGRLAVGTGNADGAVSCRCPRSARRRRCLDAIPSNSWLGLPTLTSGDRARRFAPAQ